MADSLTVCSVVYNDNKTGLFDLMVQSVRRFTYPEPQFVICDNGGNSLDKYNGLPNFTIISNQNSGFTGSLQHGDSLNKIFQSVKTPRMAIVESDCIVLKNGWDMLSMPSFKMIAAKKGEQAGQVFYHACFMVLSASLLKHGNMDFRPGKNGARGNRNYAPWEDVGWAIRNVVRPDQVRLLEFVDCKSNKGKIFNKDFQSDEFWLDGEPVLAHFGRGSNIGGKAVRNGFKDHNEQLEMWKSIALKIIH